MYRLIAQVGRVVSRELKMPVKPFEILIATAVVFAATTAPAHAYLDPGTGSLLLQGLIGGTAAGLFILRGWWARFLSFLPWRKGEKGKAADSTQQ